MRTFHETDGRNRSNLLFGKTLRTYYPSKQFPSISVTGKSCEMSCQYCNRKYLESMIAAPSPKRLQDVLDRIHKQGAIGCLISGGYTAEGKVPLSGFLDIIKETKEQTNLLINIHPGLISVNEAIALKSAKVDVVSVDVIGHEKIIHEVIGLSKTPQDYFDNLKILIDADLTVVPHIGLGFAHGTMLGVKEAIKASLIIKPSLIVFLVLMPTKGTPMENVMPPKPEEVGKIIQWTRSQSNKVELALGCMRPRGTDLDLISFQAGINRIVLPHKGLIKHAKAEGYSIERFETCCVYPF